MQAALTALEQRIASRARQGAGGRAAQKVAAAGNAYLAENAKQPGVQTTASGPAVQGRQGRHRAHARLPTDTVTVHYRGTLVDGTEFDSSYKRGQPATFPVNGVIAGWTEALQLMKEGAQYQLVIPPDARLRRPRRRWRSPGQALVFDVELIKVAPPAAAQVIARPCRSSTSNGLQLDYELHGEPGAPVVLL